MSYTETLAATINAVIAGAVFSLTIFLCFFGWVS